MWIFFELRYTIIKLVRILHLKGVPAKFRNIFETYFLSYLQDKFVKTVMQPLCHPSRNISYNHRHHLLQPSWQRIFSTSNNQKTMVNSDINSNYKASSFDRLYIWRRKKWYTVGLTGAHQRKYWNALTVGHDDDGCSCNHRAVSPSDIILCGTTFLCG